MCLIKPKEMSKKRIIVHSVMWMVASLFIASHIAHCQDFKQAIADMREVYAGLTAMHIKMNVQVYESRMEGEIYTLQVDIKKENDNYLYRYGNNKMLLNQQYFIIADGEAKELICSKRTPQTKNQMSRSFAFDLDSILNFHEAPVLIAEDHERAQYEINQKQGPVSTIYLELNKQSKLVSEVAYQYRSGPYVVITFELFDTKPQFTSQTFSADAFIEVSNGVIKTAPQYQQYHLAETYSD